VSKVEETDILVIGAGIAGLSAKLKIQESSPEISCTVIEKASGPGGHAASFEVQGEIFDEGPHLLFSDDTEMLSALGSPTPENYKTTAKVANYWGGMLLRHPAHLDFGTLTDTLLRAKIIESLEGVLDSDQGDLRNYQEWGVANFGEYVLEQFTRTYTSKYWRVEMSTLDVDWISQRISSLNRSSVIELRNALTNGTLGDRTQGQHYLTQYTYDTRGFFSLFPKLHGLEVSHNEEVLEIDMSNKLVRTSRREIRYSKLISTMPLTRLLDVTGVSMPRENLRCTSLSLLSLVLQGNTFENQPHWLYNYDAFSEAARISFPQLFSPTLGEVSKVQLEFYFEGRQESSPIINPRAELEFLKSANLVSPSASLKAHDIREIRYANIMPCVGRAESVKDISSYLSDRDVELAGRYGAWEYLWSVEAARSGFDAASRILQSQRVSLR
jgi:protoporphyrinogen oxidase